MRWAFVVGIVVVAAGIAWVAIGRESEPANNQSSQPGSGVAATPGRAAISAPAGPSLASGSVAEPHDDSSSTGTTPRPELPRDPSGSPAAPQMTSTQPFEQQTRDSRWADKTEREIRNRFAKVRGARLQAAECRHDQCLITIAGTQAEVTTSIADIEEPTGLKGFARSIVLSAPEQDGDRMVLRFYAVFDR
ncbi:MAG: hypothetical protein AB7P03_02960 [Kofleriaceae bacterium]